ncbi:MAG: phosphotransferase family protein [Solirubrobacteraceae bacterium]|nr:phosphotransferase family protein [Solirubrobacteraceae bacterium]
MEAKGADVGAVRDEDRFDVAAVDAWLRANADGFAPTGVPEVTQFSKGASNLTYQLTYPEQALILRRPPAGAKIASAHDMGREFRVQRALKASFPSVPSMVAHCPDDSVIGNEFYVMEKLDGTILRSSIPRDLGLDAAGLADLCRSFIDNLVTLHAVDPSQPDLAAIGRGEGYVARQVAGWSKRYRAARTWNVPSFEKVMDWLDAQQPADVGNCVIHNDYRLDNVVLAPGDPSQIIGVLDWEMATLGDPLMDLGGAMAYWVEAGDGRAMKALKRQPTDAPGMLTRQEVVAYYAERSGRSVEDWRFYEVFGLFRLAVIIQQIYRRYHLGQTTNPTFKRYWLAVHYFELRCRRLIRSA